MLLSVNSIVLLFAGTSNHQNVDQSNILKNSMSSSSQKYFHKTFGGK